MSFLKIIDPIKREQTVKEFLEIKKNIRANELAEKTGKIELREDLSKFFEPVTETQKETQKETQRAIMSGLRPIKKGLKSIKGLKGIKTAMEQLPEKLPQQLPQLTSYPFSVDPSSGYRTASPTLTEISEAATTSEKTEMQQEIDNSILVSPDNVFGIYDTPKGLYMGNKPVDLTKEDIIIHDYETKTKNAYKLTRGLKNLIFYRGHISESYTANDFSTYGRILKLTGAMHNNNDPTNIHFKRPRDITKNLEKKAIFIKENIWEPYTKSEIYKKKHMAFTR